MYPFKYHKPVTLAQAHDILSAHENTVLLSGGHTLLPAMKLRLAQAEHVVDLSSIPELHGIEITNGTLRIGAFSTHAQVASSLLVRNHIPALAGLAGSIADRHVRQRGTIGGSVANNDPAADYPSAVLGLAARLKTNRRIIPADDYFTGLYTTALQPGEIITSVEFPLAASASYAKFKNFASRYSIAGVFVAQTTLGVRVAVTGAGSGGVFRAVPFEEALNRHFSPQALGPLAIAPDDLMTDTHATAEYRAHLIKVMAVRAVQNPNQVLVFK